jgi:hypothetical protein
MDWSPTPQRLGHCVFALVALACAGWSVAGTTYTYSIGNSLTVDSNISAMASMAASRGVDAKVDEHIHGGVRLEYIWSHPDEVNVTPSFAGTYPQALASRGWDAVTVEPFYSYLTDDTQSILDFMNYAEGANPANRNAQFYIFARWSEQSGFPSGYPAMWNQQYAGDNGYGTATRDYFTKLIASVRQAQPQDMKPIELIPTGYVFAALDPLVTAGKLKGVTSMSQFYRDNTHMSTLGSFVASTTFYATIFKDDPEGLVPPSDYAGLDPTLVSQLESTIWNVVSTTPGTGIIAAAVPEPAMMLPAAIVLVGFAQRRRR